MNYDGSVTPKNLISIIIPIYNRANVLHRSVESILNQSYQNFELLLIDDGSTDVSYALCLDYAKKDSRIRVFHKENGGVSSARNMGLMNCRGDYIYFLDSDDIASPHALEKLYNDLIRYQADYVCCRFWFSSEMKECFEALSDDVAIVDWKKALSVFYEKDGSKRTFDVSLQTKLFQRKLIFEPQIVLFDENSNYGEDWDWLTEIVIRAKRPLLDQSLMLSVFSDCDNSLCKNASGRTIWLQRKKQKEFMVEHHFPTEDIARAERLENISLLNLILCGNSR